MIINLLGYLENSSIKFKNKIAVEEANKKLSFSQLKFKSQKIGSLITSLFNAKFHQGSARRCSVSRYTGRPFRVAVVTAPLPRLDGP